MVVPAGGSLPASALAAGPARFPRLARAELAPEAVPKNRPAHCFLNTPSSGPAPLALGRNALARSFQVIWGTTASTRGSTPASIRDSAPPYEPPTAATRG